MSGTAPNKIEAIEPRKGFKLAVTWENGGQFVISFTDDIRRGGVFAALRDEKVFAKARIGRRRRSIEWPEPQDENGEPIIDIDADALLHLAEQQKTAGALKRLLAMLHDRAFPDAEARSEKSR